MTRALLAALALLLALVYPLMLVSDWRKLRRGHFNSAPGWMRRLNRWMIHGKERRHG